MRAVRKFHRPFLINLIRGEGGLMNNTVSTGSIVMIVLCMTAGTALPLVLFVYLKRKKQASPRAFFIGWLAFLIAAGLLEQLFHTMVFASGIGRLIQSNLFLYALYGGVAAGLFEEVARYFGISRFLKNHMDNDWNSLMYGAGHGGSELFNLFVMTMANNLIYAVALNSGGAERILQGLEGEGLVQMRAMLETLASTPAYMYALGFMERISAVILQLSLSVLVFQAVKDPAQNKRLLLIAVELHALADFLAVILNSFLPAAVTEILILVIACGAAMFARKVWLDNVPQQ